MVRLKGLPGLEIRRELGEGTYRLKEVFRGLEGSPILKKLFGDGLGERLKRVMVELRSNEPRYMRVREEDGTIEISLEHLRGADDATLYLDIVHELVHIKQLDEGKRLRDPSVSYVDRPVELEAYRLTIEEARRLGWVDSAIAEYLKVEWLSEEDYLKLLRNCELERGPP